MNALFLIIVNMSIAASWLIVVVILLRVLLKKAPKWINVLLWGIVAVRLICPFALESPISLIPDSIGSGKLVSEWADDYIDDIDIYYPDSVYYDAAIGAGREPISDGEGGYYVVTKHDQLGEPDTIENTVIPVLCVAWLTGIGAMLLYAATSYIRLRNKVGASLHLHDKIWICDHIQIPFILGCFRPKIYIPSGTDEAQLPHIIAHENAHLKRHDHWWKPLGFLVLAVHWFNPLVWVAYILLCRDIELACDEKVIGALNQGDSIAYSEALLSCSVNRRMVMVCPLAFGEVGVKERVKRVLNYRKPAFWTVVVAAIASAVLAVCFLTNPSAKNTTLMGANYSIEEVLYAVTVGDEISAEPPLQYCVTADYHLYEQQTMSKGWNYIGALTPYELTNNELEQYMSVDAMRKGANIRQITDAYILKVENNNFYLVFQTKDGKTYLAYGWEDAAERGQDGSDDTRLRRLYLLSSNFSFGYVNVNFFQRSLIHTVGNPVDTFASFESDEIPGYHITGFRSGSGADPAEMTDLGFAVFQTTGEGYRLIDCKVYEDAALVENGIYFCEDPAVADIHGQMRNDNTFDVVLILNEDVDRVERIYRAEGKEDWVQAHTYINAPYMSLWPWKNSEGYTSVSQYFYDENWDPISADGTIPLNSASWEDLPDNSDASVTKWFDYLETPDEMHWDGCLEIDIPEYPGVTFRWYPEKMETVTENELVPLYTGMPIWNTYFCDLTGDGFPDLCSTISIGSGIIDNRIIVYDYANGASYTLEDRGSYDYTLWQNESDGSLWGEKKAHNSKEVIESGRLIFKNDCLQIEPFSSNVDCAQ